MRRIAVCLAVVAILVAGLFVYRENAVEAQDDVTFTVTSYSLASDGDTGECFPDGLSNFDASQPWRQVVITNAVNETVGYMDIRQGEYVEVDGNPVCAVSSTMTVKESPFYTVTVEGAYQRIVSPEAIEDFGGELFIQVG